MFIDKILENFKSQPSIFGSDRLFNELKSAHKFVLPKYKDLLNFFNLKEESPPQPFMGDWNGNLPYAKMWIETSRKLSDGIEMNVGAYVKTYGSGTMFIDVFSYTIIGNGLDGYQHDFFIMKPRINFRDIFYKHNDILENLSIVFLASNIIGINATEKTKLIKLYFSHDDDFENNLNKFSKWKQKAIITDQFRDQLIKAYGNLDNVTKTGCWEIDTEKSILSITEKGFIQPFLNEACALVSLNLLSESLKCKSTTATKVYIPNKLNKSRRKKGKLPLCNYHVLTIKMPNCKTKTKVSYGEAINHNSLHFCRGNYARYTEEKPLFGKFVGVVWRSPHIKGQNKKHIVLKDYKCRLKSTKKDK